MVQILAGMISNACCSNVYIFQEAVDLLQDQGRLDVPEDVPPAVDGGDLFPDGLPPLEDPNVPLEADPDQEIVEGPPVLGGQCGASGLDEPIDLSKANLETLEVWDPPPRGIVEEYWREGRLGLPDSPLSPDGDPLISKRPLWQMYEDLSDSETSDNIEDPNYIEISDSEVDSGVFSPLGSPPPSEDESPLESVGKPDYLKKLWE